MLIGAAVFITLPPHIKVSTRLLLTWNAGVLAFLGMAIILISRTTAQHLKQWYHPKQQSNTLIFALIVAAATASLLAVGVLLGDAKSLPKVDLTLHLGLSVLAIFESWTLLHITFGFRYANLYYRTLSIQGAGLDFPKADSADPPDYLDFLYFSFGIGMTSQVADIGVISRRIRRLVLLHSIVSFFYNTSILALTINIIAGLI